MSRANYHRKYRAKSKKSNSDSTAMEIESESLVQRRLNGTATDAEYNSMTKCHSSYGPEGFTYVGPFFGPYTITGPNALVAWSISTK